MVLHEFFLEKGENRLYSIQQSTEASDADMQMKHRLKTLTIRIKCGQLNS